MTLPGETLGGTETTCIECGAKLKIQICRSNAYYIGYWCEQCGPISRESGYYPSREAAQFALDNGAYGR